MTTVPAPGLTDTERSAVRKLERKLDQRRWQLLAALIRAWREQRRPRTQAGADVDLLSVLVSNEASVAALTRALGCALAHGASLSAEALVERLLASGGAAALPRESVPLVLETLLLVGARSRAQEVALAWGDELARVDRGVTALQLLGLAEPRPFLPTGYPNMLQLNATASKASPRPPLTSVLDASPRVWAWAPELHLLLYNHLREQDRPAALRFLNRFLAVHGLPKCMWSGAGAALSGALDPCDLERERQRSEEAELVSVLVAARNAADTIGRALDSLLTQSYEKLEILVGDDASDDGTLKALRERYGSTRRVRLFRGKRQQGAYNMRNALSLHARGELLTFHDADDVALPSRIARQVEHSRRAGVELSVCSLLRLNSDGQFVFFKDQKATRLCLASMLLKRSTFEVLGRFRPSRVGADLELFARVRARFGAAAISRIKAPLVFGSWSNTSLTRGPGTEALEDGYRSPVRRLYSELVYWQERDGFSPLGEPEMSKQLRSRANVIEPAELERIE